MRIQFYIPNISIWVILLSISFQPVFADELDITMRVLEEGETPEDIVQKIQLPPLPTAENDDVVSEDLEQEDQEGQEDIVDDVKSQTEAISQEAVETVTDNVKDAISDTGETEEAIKEGLGDLLENKQLPNDVLTEEPQEKIQIENSESVDAVDNAIDSLYQQEMNDIEDIEPPEEVSDQLPVDALPMDDVTNQLDDVQEDDLPIDDINDSLNEL